jgi:hypothetical protein
MDTWSVAQMLLDLVFAVTIVGVVVGLLYFREKRIYSRIANMQSRAPEPATSPRIIVEEAQQPILSIAAEPTPVRTRTPRAASTPKAQKPVRRAGAVSANRAEKYLEAVRMYRQGSDKGAIERELGISFMELELLGRIK